MILQIDDRLKVDPWWGESGCGLMSIFYFVNKFTNYPFDIENILVFGDSFRKHGLVTDEFFINDWEGIFRFFRFDVIYHNKHESPDTICKSREFEILDWYNPGTKKRHFTAGDGKGRVTYDPMGESITMRDGFLRSKRIFRRV
jgi:hypothetical protein